VSPNPSQAQKAKVNVANTVLMKTTRNHASNLTMYYIVRAIESCDRWSVRDGVCLRSDALTSPAEGSAIVSSAAECSE